MPAGRRKGSALRARLWRAPLPRSACCGPARAALEAKGEGRWGEQQKDVYQRITDQIVAAIECGAGEWRMPWHGTGEAGTARPVNASGRRPYRGVNVLALWAAAEAGGYPSGIWATYRQWSALGAQVRRGERGSLVVFWRVYDGEEGDDATPEDERDGRGNRRFFARGYTVFNAVQVDGYVVPAGPQLPATEREAQAERFFDALGIATVYGGSRAFYRPSTDTIHLPPFEAFRDAASAYSVRAHESAHATGAPHRLARDLSGRFGSDAYAAEELVAELTAAFICGDLGLAVEPRPDHAAYVASWLNVLLGDKRAIFTAAAKAQQAADWMHQQQTAEKEKQAAA
jgi:antirestriction protein ArdC